MLAKVFAVLRAIFLVYLLYYAFRATPLIMGLPENVTDPYPICRDSNLALQRGLWMAIGWIAFETVVSIGVWFLVARRKKPLEPDIPKAGSGEPPFAPPPHG